MPRQPVHPRRAGRARALEAWQAARDAAGCPERLPAITVPVTEAAGLVTAAPVWATRSSPPFDAAGMDGIAIRAADTLGASETSPVVPGPRRLRRGRHRRPHARRPGRGRDARARALRRRRPGRTARRCPSLPARPLHRRGRQRRRATAPGRPPAASRRPGRGGRGRREAAFRPEETPCPDPAHRRRDSADRNGAGHGPDPGHELADARRAGARGRVRGADPADRAGLPAADRRSRHGGGGSSATC